MLDFELQRCTRKCAKTDRELLPGEAVVSALVSADGEIKRVDYAADAWDEPPADTIAWWKSQMPDAHGKRVHWAPHEVMFEYFQRLADDESKADVRFVLALLMVRRRMMRLENSERDEAGEEVMVLYSPRHESEFRVRSVMPPPSRIAEIQNELSQLLITPAG